jgi:hypothetical protein
VQTSVSDLREILGNAHLDLSHESRAQDGIEAALLAAGVPFEREVQLGPGERVDFLVDGGLGVEVKIRCSPAQLLRQLHRYAQHPRIQRLIVVTASPRLAALPSTLRGRSIEAIILTGSLF